MICRVSKGNVQCKTITKQHNNVSSKMLQAQMVHTNGKYTYKYSNSKTDTINATIISQDYEKNKGLLFNLSYAGYLRYYNELYRSYNLDNLLPTILASLSQEEKDRIYCVEPVVIPPPPPPPIEGKTYYVMTRVINASSKYFIFKNYLSNDIFIPNHIYTFDLSDSSNIGSTLAFSYMKGDAPLSSPIVVVSGSIVTLTIPIDTSYNYLYPFNSAENDVYKKYNLSGYTVGSFYINQNAYSQPLSQSCSTNDTISYRNPNTFTYESKYYELLKLTASSMIYVYDYFGPVLSIRDIKSKETLKGIPYRKFGFYKDRTYYLYVPKIYALALLNNNQVSNITYEGDADKIIPGVNVIGTEADGTYDFYYGTIRITVNGSFQPISIYTLTYGYIHGYQRLVYSDSCASVPWDTNPYRFPF